MYLIERILMKLIYTKVLQITIYPKIMWLIIIRNRKGKFL